MAKPKPLYSFKIYPLKTKLFYGVHVFNALKELRGYAAEVLSATTSKTYSKNAAAMTIGEIQFKDGVMVPNLGQILLCTKYLDDGTIAHESCHAMFRLIARMGWKKILLDNNEYEDPVTDEEESACVSMERMMNQIKNGIKKHSVS